MTKEKRIMQSIFVIHKTEIHTQIEIHRAPKFKI